MNDFKAHEGLRKAHDAFNKALRVIQEVEQYSDTREIAKPYRLATEQFRDASEKLLFDAANFRTDMIRSTGCDASCHT